LGQCPWTAYIIALYNHVFISQSMVLDKIFQFKDNILWKPFNGIHFQGMKVWKVHILFGKAKDKLTEMITIDLNSLHIPKESRKFVQSINHVIRDSRAFVVALNHGC
jgi:hypothetical protein